MKDKDNFILIYDDAFSSDECQKIREHLDILEKRSILINSKEQSHLYNQDSVSLSHDYTLPAWSLFGENMFSVIQSCVDEYINFYSILDSKSYLMYDLKLKKIPVGGGFHQWHYENGGVVSSSREFVVQIYLNDDFEGGETEFLYLNQRVQAKTGRVIIFPAGYTHTHRGNPPIGNTKYLATTWAYLQNAT